ncbi:glycosyltransferase [Wenyingzhuangia sp. 1_MG-2023]|nr:glycosyltransferase [Wenyingzhuangia sp. 1_MG-2023]
MMKVIQVIGSLDVGAGGPSRSVPQTCEYLSKIGVDITIYTRPSDNVVDLPCSDNFKVLFKNSKQLLQDGLKIAKEEVDLIHLQHVWDPYVHIMAWIARLKGIPYIITPRGMLEPWIMQQNPLKKKTGMWLYQRKDLAKANVIHVTCDLEKENVQKLGFINTMVNIPNGINVPLIPSPKENYGTKKIVFLSRIHLKKGIEILLDAWKNIDHQGWELEIAGNGENDYIESINNKIGKEQIKNVALVGPQYDNAKWDFIKNADVFILPTYSENFGIVVAEALAVGVPVITTSGTPWEELNTNNCGWWIELSVENVAKTLKQAMVATKEEMELKGKNGIELIKEKYDIRSVASELKLVYEKVLKKD